jgi:hypothetical protein
MCILRQRALPARLVDEPGTPFLPFEKRNRQVRLHNSAHIGPRFAQALSAPLAAFTMQAGAAKKVAQNLPH